ncbi:MAG: hypothetical protein H9535_08340 [Ignavibacteria bacterium]|nr:hypothetical protein [Ignavibacteria bacterium]
MPSSRNIIPLETLFREARKEVDDQSGKQEPLLSQDDITAILNGYKPQTSEHPNTSGGNTNTDNNKPKK